MKVEKIGDMLAVMIPADVADALDQWDGVEIRRTADRGRLSDAELAALWQQMRVLSKPLPADYRFDREEANAR